MTQNRRTERTENLGTSDSHTFKYRMEKYLKYDKMTLRFEAVLASEAHRPVETHYSILYFLADDSIEIHETLAQGMGKTSSTVFLKKGRFPKAPAMTHCPGMRQTPQEYFCPADLIIPSNISIYGRVYTLVSCDKFTQDFYASEFGIQQVSHVLPTLMDACETSVDTTPPYNGFGSEEDSLMNCLSLIPKPPKIDFDNWVKNNGIVLRFVCRLISPTEDDKIKRFLVNYFMENKTLMVSLMPNRNAGIQPSKFLERGTYKNPENGGAPFSVTDLEIGKILSVNKYSLQLLSADDFTMKYLMQCPERPVATRVWQIVKRCGLLHQRAIKEMCLGVAGEMWVNIDAFGKLLEQSGVTLNLTDTFYLFCATPRNDKGETNFKSFCDLISKN